MNVLNTIDVNYEATDEEVFYVEKTDDNKFYAYSTLGSEFTCDNLSDLLSQINKQAQESLEEFEARTYDIVSDFDDVTASGYLGRIKVSYK